MRASPIEPDGVFDGLRWSPIIRWAVLDIVLTVIAIFPTLFLLAGSRAVSDDEEAVGRALDQAVESPECLRWIFLIGTAITVFAAFRAVR